MRLTFRIFVFVGLISQFKCQNDSTTEVPTTTMEPTTFEPTTGEPEVKWGTPGLYGGSYYIDNRSDVHYIHGTYQVPEGDYYKHLWYQCDESQDALDCYLSFGLNKMTDRDFQYDDYHYWNNDLARNITDNETIRSDSIIKCHPNAIFLCPENSETVCLMNGTIYCMSKIDVVKPCPNNDTIACVSTTVPCVHTCDSTNILLQCLANITVEDVYQDRHGMTISRVGDTFIVVPAFKQEERTFCVSVIVDPVPPTEA